MSKTFVDWTLVVLVMLAVSDVFQSSRTAEITVFPTT